MTFHVDISLVGICDTDQLWLPVDECSNLDRKFMICLHNYFCNQLRKDLIPLRKTHTIVTVLLDYVYFRCVSAEFKIRRGKFMDKWPNTLQSIKPF